MIVICIRTLHIQALSIHIQFHVSLIHSRTLSLLPIYRLYDIYHLLFVVQHPVYLIIVAGSEIHHNMLIPIICSIVVCKLYYCYNIYGSTTK